MKLKIFVVLLALAVAWFVGRRYAAGLPEVGGDGGAVASAPGVQRVDQTFKLAPRARVEVSGISGSVEVAVADADDAEVHVENTARDADALEDHKVTVAQTAAGLTVRGENPDGPWSLWRWLASGGGGKARQRVTLKLPRGAEFVARGIGGGVRVGALDGPVRISGVGGGVEIERATGAAEISGINGGVNLALAELGARGARISGVNGGVELRVPAGLNADLDVSGMNGGFSNDAPNATVEEQSNRSRAHARIGNGGFTIKISGVNGSVHLIGN